MVRGNLFCRIKVNVFLGMPSIVIVNGLGNLGMLVSHFVVKPLSCIWFGTAGESHFYV